MTVKEAVSYFCFAIWPDGKNKFYFSFFSKPFIYATRLLFAALPLCRFAALPLCRFAALPLRRFAASLIIMCSLFANDANTQSAIFVEEPTNTLMTASEQQKLTETLLYEPNILNTKVVAVNAIESFLVGSNQVQMNLPGVTESLLMTTDYANSLSPNHYFWTGASANGSMMTLGRNASGTYGSAVYAPTNQHIKIASLSANRSVLINVAPSPIFTYGDGECATLALPDDDQDSTVIDRDCQFGVIRVLFLFTPLAGTVTTMTAACSMVIDELNAASTGSGLQPTNITFQFAGALPMPTGFTESFVPIESDLSTAKNVAAVATLRASAFADIVVFVTGAVHSTDAVGVADRIAAKSSRAFCMVEAPFLNGPFFTGCHEIGHLMGARHQRPSTCGALSSGADMLTKHHGFLIGTSFQTVLAQLGCGQTRVLRWSTPEAPFMGMPTGDFHNNNRKRISERASKVGCFFADPPTAPPIGNFVGIDGPSQICANGSNYIYKAMFNPAALTPPITFSWELSLTGFAPWQSWGSSSSLNLSGSSFSGNSATLKLTMSDANGPVGFSTMQIFKNPFCFTGSGDDRAVDEKTERTGAFSIRPNPNEGFFTLLNIPSFSTLTIFDVQGRPREGLSFKTKEGQINFDVDASHLKNGVYFLRFQSEKATFTHKIIKQ